MKQLLDGGKFFEGPRWHEGHWYVSDLYQGHVLKITTRGEASVVAEVPQQPSGLGWMPDGSLLVVSMLDRKLLRRHPDGRLSQHADLVPYTGGLANDMVVDRHGRAYIGNLGFDLFGGGAPAHADIVMVETDGRCRIVADDVKFPNGMVITPDGRTLIVAETFGGNLLAFDIADDGSLSRRRDWARIGNTPSWESVGAMLQTSFAPDGLALDAEGHVWAADALNGRACRFAPGGAIGETVIAPNGWGLYSCALGGEDGKTLLVCVAPDFHDGHRKAKAEATLYTYPVRVPVA
ncbi:MAG: SMP-30/gluconolactonase/LRE family protein [Panacagrimonas sp.]